MQRHTIFDDTCLLDKCLKWSDSACMELILIVAGLLLLDILAMRFGVDSRILDVHDEAELRWRASLSVVRPPSLRVRLAHVLLALAERIEPARA